MAATLPRVAAASSADGSFAAAQGLPTDLQASLEAKLQHKCAATRDVPDAHPIATLA